MESRMAPLISFFGASRFELIQNILNNFFKFIRAYKRLFLYPF
jgi:hypothetical protein